MADVAPLIAWLAGGDPLTVLFVGLVSAWLAWFVVVVGIALATGGRGRS